MKCLLGIDPEKTQKCKPSECASCGWEAAEAARRREYVKEHGLTLCADGFRRLIIRKEKDMATPYKECLHCGAHLDSGEKCECRAEEIEAKNSQKYACGLTEQDVESGWECPLDNPNETVLRQRFTRTPLNTAGGKAKERFRRSWRLFIRRYPKRWRNTATGSRFFISLATLAGFVAKRTEARIAEAALTIRKIRTPVVPRRARSPKGSRQSLPT